ncbi:clavesin-2-like [Amphiura filiformis]|uniref:clavesin-2-like n=1 Tax=Amphiura filiformis TaxID=82378 RepID=UPI003B210D0C
MTKPNQIADTAVAKRSRSSPTMDKEAESNGSLPDGPPDSPDSALGASASSPDEVNGDDDTYICTLGPETQKKAENELGETDLVRQLAIMNLKKRMEQRSDIKFCHDERFLLRFLRAKKFEVERAFNSIVKYHELHIKHPDFFKDYKPTAIKHVLDDGFPMVLSQLDEEGRPVIAMKAVGSWDPKKYSVVDIAKAVFMVMENLVEDDEVQVNGVVLLVDLDLIGPSHAITFSPSVAKKLTTIFQNCVPVRLQGIHFINEPLVMDAVFTCMKPFMQDKIKDRMLMHGSNFESLKCYIPLSILPTEWGGEAGPYDIDNTAWKKEFLSIDHEFSPITDDAIVKKKKKKKLGLKRATKGTVKRIAKIAGKKSGARKVYEADKAKEEEKSRKQSKTGMKTSKSSFF